MDIPWQIFGVCYMSKCNMSVSENKIELPLQLVELDRHRQVEAASVGGESQGLIHL